MPFHGWPPFGVLLITVLIVLIAIRLFRTGRAGPVRFERRDGSTRERPSRPGHSTEDAALATLRDRLAAGDITIEEYLSRSSVLR